MENVFELSFDKKKACIYELDKAATEIGNLLGAAVKTSHISNGITKEEFWRNLFLAKGTNWNIKAGQYMDDQPLKDPRYDDPQRCPDDPYREMDLQFWIKYLLDGGCRVISQEQDTVCYAEDSASFFHYFGLDCCYKGEYPHRRGLSGTYRGVLFSLKAMRNSYVGHVTSKRIEETTLKTLEESLDTLMRILEPLCNKNWAGKKYAVALREATNVLFYRSLQEIPYVLSDVLTVANLEPESIKAELLAQANIRFEDGVIYLNCDPVYFSNMVKSLVQMDVPEDLWITQLRRTQERTVDDQALLKLSDINEMPLSSKDCAVDLAEMTPEELLKQAENGDLNAQLALAEYCKNVQKDHAAAFHWWHRAAESGHAMAQYQVGFYLLNGIGVAQNIEEAVAWFRKSVEQGDAQAQYWLGSCYARGFGVTKDPVTALSWFQRSAEQGYEQAQYKMGVCCQDGIGTDKNLPKALKWYLLAAEQGNSSAQNSLAVMLEDGSAGEKDPQAAFVWYRKAAEQKSREAMWHVGRCYAGAIGTEKDMKEAVVWYGKAAEQNHSSAQYRLGVCYQNGDGVDKDPAEAVRWFRKAAAAGNKYAQFSLAYCYDYGTGTEQDREKAANWYREAADQENAAAQCNLGYLYENGTGVPKNLNKAFYWYQKGAVNGNVVAQSNLSNCFENGIGIEKNLEKALLWTEKVLKSNHADLVKKAQRRYDRLQKLLQKNG